MKETYLRRCIRNAVIVFLLCAGTTVAVVTPITVGIIGGMLPLWLGVLASMACLPLWWAWYADDLTPAWLEWRDVRANKVRTVEMVRRGVAHVHFVNGVALTHGETLPPWGDDSRDVW